LPQVYGKSERVTLENARQKPAKSGGSVRCFGFRGFDS
jgi:hypothetical protein